MAQAETVIAADMRASARKALSARPLRAGAARARRHPRPHRVAGRPAAAVRRAVVELPGAAAVRLRQRRRRRSALGVLEGRGRWCCAVAAGLVVGKPLGIVGRRLRSRCAWASPDKPDAYSWRQLAGAGALAGIGFTMSLYIAAKAFPQPRTSPPRRSPSSSPRSWRPASVLRCWESPRQKDGLASGARSIQKHDRVLVEFQTCRAHQLGQLRDRGRTGDRRGQARAARSARRAPPAPASRATIRPLRRAPRGYGRPRSLR